MSVAVGAQIRPFPFASLEALTRADVARATQLRRLAHELVNVAGIEDALAELVGERVSIAVRKLRRLEAPRGADDAIGVVLGTAGERFTRRVLVEVDGALGATLIAKALRQKAPRVVDGARTPSPALAGALAAVVVAVLRRAHAGAVTKVIAAGPGAALARDLLLAERDVTTATLTVVVGDDAFEARISVPDAMTPAPREESLSDADLLDMGDARIAIPLLLTTTLSTPGDLAELAFGDVFVPSRFAIAGDAGGSITGAVALVAPTSERGLSADLAENGRLVVRGLLESHPWGRENTMAPESREPNLAATNAVPEALEEAPVVVRVELGTVEMKAREWAQLAPGDVIALGRRVGDPAVLRVGGVELARGELVQVDGEYGVRILGRGKPRGEAR
jgi:flagellar motor switch/type III secretory pathway protein FliN